MTTILDVPEVLALLKRAVDEKGTDYVYPRKMSTGGTCDYSRDGVPSCIVGHVINYADPDAFQQVVEIEQANQSSWPATDFDVTFDEPAPDESDELGSRDSEYMEEIKFRLTHEAAQVAAVAQSLQDGGETWGYAYDEAVREAKRLGYDVDIQVSHV